MLAATVYREPGRAIRYSAEHGIDVPLGYGLLVKSLVTVEGVARALYPDVDLVETARPFVTELFLEHYADPARIYERAPRAVRAALLELVR